jgi:tRNA(fMet)-specific endonuclease VapC
VGIVLDSSVLVAAERAGKNPRQVIDELASQLGDTAATLSVLTVAELAHGIERADSPTRRTTRERFLQELLRAIPVEPVTTRIAIRAGKIDGSLHARGLHVSLADLLIGATALELGYSVVTHNVRHFEMIPNLEVRQLL